MKGDQYAIQVNQGARLYTTKMPMSRTAFVAIALALSGYAQTKTDFSGTWKLNIAKSDFGTMPAPESRSDVVEQTADSIKDTVTSVTQQGDMNYALNIKTDGTETAAHVAGRDLKISAAWDGPALAVTTKLDYEGNDVLIKSNWTLSADGNTWTQAAHITSPMGEMDTKLVFDKSTPGAAPAPPPTTSTAATTTAPTTGGPKPNFTGVWKLNVDKSDFGPIPGPESETDTIEHNDPNIKLAVDQQGAQGKRKYDLDLVIDGKEETHKLGDQDIKTTAQWEGNALNVVTKLMFQDNEVLIKAVYTMLPDGKTVNVATHFSSAMGEGDQKMVFDKQ